MKIALNLILFGCGLLGVSHFAQARDWAFLNYQDGICEIKGTSPAGMDDYLRSKGMTPNLERFKNSKNELERVDIHFKQLNGDGVTLRFFTSMEVCGEFRAQEIKNGNIIDKDELR